MYTKHFGLRREPFSIAPDPRFLFMSERHREALAHLLYGLEGTGGVVLLTAAASTESRVAGIESGAPESPVRARARICWPCANTRRVPRTVSSIGKPARALAS